MEATRVPNTNCEKKKILLFLNLALISFVCFIHFRGRFSYENPLFSRKRNLDPVFPRNDIVGQSTCDNKWCFLGNLFRDKKITKFNVFVEKRQRRRRRRRDDHLRMRNLRGAGLDASSTKKIPSPGLHWPPRQRVHSSSVSTVHHSCRGHVDPIDTTAMAKGRGWSSQKSSVRLSCACLGHRRRILPMPRAYL